MAEKMLDIKVLMELLSKLGYLDDIKQELIRLGELPIEESESEFLETWGEQWEVTASGDHIKIDAVTEKEYKIIEAVNELITGAREVIKRFDDGGIGTCNVLCLMNALEEMGLDGRKLT